MEERTILIKGKPYKQLEYDWYITTALIYVRDFIDDVDYDYIVNLRHCIREIYQHNLNFYLPDNIAVDKEFTDALIAYVEDYWRTDFGE